MQILISSIIPNCPRALHSFVLIADKLISQNRTPLNNIHSSLKHSLLQVPGHTRHDGTVLEIKLFNYRTLMSTYLIYAGTIGDLLFTPHCCLLRKTHPSASAF